MSGIAPQGGQGIQIASVGQLVQIDDLDLRLGNEGMDEIGADKTGTTSHQDAPHGDFQLEGDVVVEIRLAGRLSATAVGHLKTTTAAPRWGTTRRRCQSPRIIGKGR